jgi:hypothetical protein
MRHRFASVRLASLALLLSLSAACAKREELGWTRVDAAAHPPAPPMDDPNSPSRIASDRASPRNSRGAFWGLLVLATGSVALAMAAAGVRRWRIARLERAFDRDKPLANGPSVVFGTVESTEREAPLSVRVRQHGTEGYNKGWRYTWTEQDREVRAESFSVRTTQGQLVLIEVSKDVELRDPLTRIERYAETERTHIAEVEDGDEVFAVGELSGVRASSGPYRDGEARPVLRAPRLSKMIISCERPGEADGARARFHFGWLVATVTWMVFCTTVVFGNFATLMLGHSQIETTPESVGQWRVWVKPKGRPGGWQYHYAVRARTSDGRLVEDEISRQLYDEVLEGTVTRLPFIVSSLRSSVVQYGTVPLANVAAPSLAGLGAFGLSFLYLSFASMNLPWYRQRKVVESGSGRLKDSKWE